jgi:hypothetical protein
LLEDTENSIFGAAVPKYAKWLIVTEKNNVFHSTFTKIPIKYSSQCTPIPTTM